MQTITSSAELKNAIQLLEIEHDIKGRQLKDQLYITYESLKPINLLRSTLKEITSSRDLIDNISGTVMGMAGGFLSKKIFIGKSGSAFRKLIGSLLQFGITNLVSRNSEVIKSLSQSLFQYFFRKKNELQ
jgi:hypothetical protein